MTHLTPPHLLTSQLPHHLSFHSSWPSFFFFFFFNYHFHSLFFFLFIITLTMSTPAVGSFPVNDYNNSSNNNNNNNTEDQESSKKQQQKRSVSLFKLFAFADFYDYILMSLGSIGACVHGVSVPVFFIFFGKLINIIGLAYLFPKTASHKVAKVYYFN